MLPAPVFLLHLLRRAVLVLTACNGIAQWDRRRVGVQDWKRPKWSGLFRSACCGLCSEKEASTQTGRPLAVPLPAQGAGK